MPKQEVRQPVKTNPSELIPFWGWPPYGSLFVQGFWGCSLGYWRGIWTHMNLIESYQPKSHRSSDPHAFWYFFLFSDCWEGFLDVFSLSPPALLITSGGSSHAEDHHEPAEDHGAAATTIRGGADGELKEVFCTGKRVVLRMFYACFMDLEDLL